MYILNPGKKQSKRRLKEVTFIELESTLLSSPSQPPKWCLVIFVSIVNFNLETSKYF